MTRGAGGGSTSCNGAMWLLHASIAAAPRRQRAAHAYQELHCSPVHAGFSREAGSAAARATTALLLAATAARASTGLRKQACMMICNVRPGNQIEAEYGDESLDVVWAAVRRWRRSGYALGLTDCSARSIGSSVMSLT